MKYFCCGCRTSLCSV